MLKSVAVVLGFFIFVYFMSKLFLNHFKGGKNEKSLADTIIERHDATTSDDATE